MAQRWCTGCRYRGNVLLGEYTSALEAASSAEELYLELGDRTLAAHCKASVGDVYRVLGDYNRAKKLLEEALKTHNELGGGIHEANTRYQLALVMRIDGDHAGAIEHLTAARLTFNSVGDTLFAANCTCTLGLLNTALGNAAAGIAELEASRAIFISLGHQTRIAEATRFLGAAAQYAQENSGLAEKYLEEAQQIYRAVGDLHGIAYCAEQFGHVRNQQECEEEALVQFKLARRIFEKLQLQDGIQRCQEQIKLLESTQSWTVEQCSDDF